MATVGAGDTMTGGEDVASDMATGSEGGKGDRERDGDGERKREGKSDRTGPETTARELDAEFSWMRIEWCSRVSFVDVDRTKTEQRRRRKQASGEGSAAGLATRRPERGATSRWFLDERKNARDKKKQKTNRMQGRKWEGKEKIERTDADRKRKDEREEKCRSEEETPRQTSQSVASSPP